MSPTTVRAIFGMQIGLEVKGAAAPASPRGNQVQPVDSAPAERRQREGVSAQLSSRGRQLALNPPAQTIEIATQPNLATRPVTVSANENRHTRSPQAGRMPGGRFGRSFAGLDPRIGTAIDIFA